MFSLFNTAKKFNLWYFICPQMELEDIGSIKKMRIGHDGKGTRKTWFLEKVNTAQRQLAVYYPVSGCYILVVEFLIKSHSSSYNRIQVVMPRIFGLLRQVGFLGSGLSRQVLL